MGLTTGTADYLPAVSGKPAEFSRFGACGLTASGLAETAYEEKDPNWVKEPVLMTAVDADSFPICGDGVLTVSTDQDLVKIRLELVPNRKLLQRFGAAI